jgi:hypothetical protein
MCHERGSASEDRKSTTEKFCSIRMKSGSFGDSLVRAFTPTFQFMFCCLSRSCRLVATTARLSCARANITTSRFDTNLSLLTSGFDSILSNATKNTYMAFGQEMSPEMGRPLPSALNLAKIFVATLSLDILSLCIFSKKRLRILFGFLTIPMRNEYKNARRSSANLSDCYF